MSHRSKSFSSMAMLFACILLILLVSSCGGKSMDTPAIPDEPWVDVGASETVEEPQPPEMQDAPFEEADIPDDFPPSFPIPEDARIASTVGMGDEDEFRVYISLTTMLEDSLSYYRGELANRGWSIDEEETTMRGVEMAIRGEDYEGELLFVEGEMGVALDVHLFPIGTGEEIPGVPPGLGESTTLGEGTSSFPADFPIPSSYNPIDLNDTLRAEGYELAFSYVGIAEMGMVDFNIAVMSAGWEIGDPTLAGVSGVYIIPFFHPETGFEGYAYITSNPGQFNLDIGGAVLIAFAPGSP